MSEIRFYHLERQSLEQALPGLLNKALEGGHKICVKTTDESAAEKLNEALWTYQPDSFLPHGTAKDGHSEAQPIFITADDDNPNAADVLIITGNTPAKIDGFTLVCRMFDGNNPEELQNARAHWKELQDTGDDHTLTYWQQGDKGWKKKQ